MGIRGARAVLSCIDNTPVLSVLAVTFPFFALVLAGYLAARRRMLPFEAIGGLNTFVLFFALPCMLYRFGASTPIAQMLDPTALATWLLCALLVVAGTVKFSMNARIRWNDASFGALVAAFPNTGFMGVPLLVALFGSTAAGPVICTVLADLLVTSSLCIALAQAHEASGQGRRAAVSNALRGALSTPLPWAIALGALSAATGLRLPGPLEEIVRLLGESATPVALFTIGSVLWRASRHAHTRTPPRRYLPVALLKLVVHPALVMGLGLAARQIGLAVPPDGLLVLVLVAALPSASNVSMLAERFGADNGRIARIIMASTILAFGSFTFIAWMFGVAAR